MRIFTNLSGIFAKLKSFTPPSRWKQGLGGVIVTDSRFQMSAQPPVKKNGQLIEKETEVSYERSRWPEQRPV